MFGRRKKPAGPMDPEDVGEICKGVIRVTGRHLAAREGCDPTSFSAALELDEQQRVTAVANSLADGLPFLPTPDLIEQLNGVFAPFREVDLQHRLATLDFTFDHGAVTTSMSYRTS